MEPLSPSKSKSHVMGFGHNGRILKMGSAIFIVLTLVMVGGFCILQTASKRGAYYTVILDCGSTGTRVGVYKWMLKYGSNLPVLLDSYPGKFDSSSGCQYHCMQSEPGLDKFVGNSSGVVVSLEPLIRLAEQWVPRENHASTPIFVLATAGMRRLETEIARQVLEDVENVVKKHGFLYKREWIRVLSGREEAYYGWVSLNFKMGVFGNLSRLPSLGLLDLGGSSLQVVTEVDDGSREDEDGHLLVSNIGSIEHRLLAYSLPAFGFNEAFDRTVVMLTRSEVFQKRVDGVVEVIHPCLSSRFLQNYTCCGCFGLDHAIHGNLTNTTEELNTILLGGSSNWEECKVVARASAVNLSNPILPQQTEKSSCIGLSSSAGNILSNLTSHSHVIRHYNALSGFFAISNRLNFSRTANLMKMWETGEHLCPRLWADHTSTLGQDCFRVAYMASLIGDALCLTNVDITFGPGDISWTLGAAMIEGGYLWLSSARSVNGIFDLRNNGMISFSSPILLFVILLALLFIVHYSQVKLPMPSRKASSPSAGPPFYVRRRRLPS